MQEENNNLPQLSLSQEVAISANIDEMSERQRIKLAAKMLGYKELPPTIREFTTSKYYLGEQCKNLYPYWREKLDEIFPNEIETRYTFLVATGSIGCGEWFAA